MTLLSASRKYSHLVGHFAAYAVECFCIAVVGFLFLTASLAGFKLGPLAGLWGDFLTHYYAASSSAQHPVNVVILSGLVILTLAFAAMRLSQLRGRLQHWKSAHD